ncbi:hypothetical protein D9758_009845 [Tetrapyrgos nigripes]|uniref:Carboxylic ester hydrolase n=1 Tax=Tetrapyrgos nigripes TaxID=182062 RepID=A0A8H5GMH2_9AGAR|nr:hypothetical protein D9758_009845 [Tetrapyrgos nigripes]
MLIQTWCLFLEAALYLKKLGYNDSLSMLYHRFRQLAACFLPVWSFLPSVVFTQAPPGFNFDSACSSLTSKLHIPNATVFAATLIAGGSIISFPDTDASCAAAPQLVPEDVCRVTMFVATSERSGINMEAWLPRNWTGRFLSTGNGGLAGCIQYVDMAYASGLGFATVGANNGHNGTSGQPFLNNAEVVEDFAFRSVHTNVIVGKEVTRAFFGVPHTKSFWLGCSTGGRQGLKSVQDFPEDFDGVVAGAPAADWNHLMDWSGNFFLITGPSSAPTFLTLTQWFDAVNPDILKQCDGIDGVTDEIIEDPNLCNYDPSGLICGPGQDNTTCITTTQAETIKKVFSPFFIDGKLAFPRYQPGSVSTTSALLISGAVFPFTADWFRFVVFNNPNFDVSTLNESSFALAQQLDPFHISTFKGDISAFKDRNGKLLTYHGQADSLISPINSERYYNIVSDTMNLHPSQLDDFYRFFRISGMGHCSGGNGAWEIGQTLPGAANTVTPGSPSLDPEMNVLMAMVRWVEEGIAPDTVLGTKFVNDDPASGVQFSRRHCRFPKRTTFVGDDSTKPDSWTCV